MRHSEQRWDENYEGSELEVTWSSLEPEFRYLHTLRHALIRKPVCVPLFIAMGSKSPSVYKYERSSKGFSFTP